MDDATTGRLTQKPELDGLAPYEPGLSAEALMRERGLPIVVKLGSNEGPWGPVPSAADAIARAIPNLNRYPDGAFHELRSLLAARVGVAGDHVVLGNGADSILINLSLAMLRPEDEVVFGWPSFVTYPLSVRKVGAVPVQVPLDSSHTYDLDAMLAAVTERTRMVYVCNPNNPTGTYVGRGRLGAFLDALPDDVLCVVDEAYHEYVEASDYPDCIAEHVATGRGNVLALRTFSKIYGLAGIRVGWGVGPAHVVRAIDTVRGPFELNALANEAAIASLGADDELDRRRGETRAGRAALTDALVDLGLSPIPGAANFVCVPLEGRLTGRELFTKLLDHGVIIRPLDNFGMPDAVRITVGTPEETQRAIDALRAVLE